MRLIFHARVRVIRCMAPFHAIFDQRGGTSVEYALIAVLIAAGIAAAVTGFGVNVSRLFQTVNPFP